MAELRESEPERTAEIIIEPDIQVYADRGLLRVALQNLLSNAWKFTARKTTARIEVGARENGDHTEIYVRDNGAGFDMTYASKLFMPFQRLHSTSEFAGTGIGLATVQRVIRRHGGAVRGEAQPGEGATFAFSLNGRE
jgi:light-regulated signal transduction histidine kinase (bacteriophytochrome)